MYMDFSKKAYYGLVKQCKHKIEVSIETLSGYPESYPEDFGAGSYLGCCCVVLGEINMAYAMGFITPEESHSYRDIVESYINNVCPDGGVL